MKAKSYEVTGPINGVCKQSAIWIKDVCCISPLVYLQRPKWIKDDAIWNEIVSSVRINLPVGKEVK